MRDLFTERWKGNATLNACVFEALPGHRVPPTLTAIVVKEAMHEAEAILILGSAIKRIQKQVAQSCDEAAVTHTLVAPCAICCGGRLCSHRALS